MLHVTSFFHDTFQMNVLYSFHTILCTLYGAALKIKKGKQKLKVIRLTTTNHSSKPTMTNTNNFSIIFYKLNYIFLSQLFFCCLHFVYHHLHF